MNNTEEIVEVLRNKFKELPIQIEVSPYTENTAELFFLDNFLGNSRIGLQLKPTPFVLALPGYVMYSEKQKMEALKPSRNINHIFYEVDKDGKYEKDTQIYYANNTPIKNYLNKTNPSYIDAEDKTYSLINIFDSARTDQVHQFSEWVKRKSAEDKSASPLHSPFRAPSRVGFKLKHKVEDIIVNAIMNKYGLREDMSSNNVNYLHNKDPLSYNIMKEVGPEFFI